MSFVYGKPYKVPVWISIDGKLGQKGQQIIDLLKPYEPYIVAWPADTFHLTIKALASQGWHHETRRQRPFAANKDFIMVAVTKHLKGKHLSGSPTQAYHTLNRNIEVDGDYNRLFNQILDIEPSISLCQVFDIGALCHNDGKQKKVFLTFGAPPTNILQRLADRVITVGEEGAEVVTSERTPEDVTKEVVTKVREFLGI